jgi:hypothetical protein
LIPREVAIGWTSRAEEERDAEHPVNLENYKLTVVDPPGAEDEAVDGGHWVAATDREGRAVFTVALFAKAIPGAVSVRRRGGDLGDPDRDPARVEEGARVVLVNPTSRPYRIENAGRVTAGSRSRPPAWPRRTAPTPRPAKDQ